MKYFLAVARHRRLTGAAKALGVDHTTVGRRIAALERAAGQRLFDRAPTGWDLTESGQRLLGPAETIATAVASAEDALSSTRSGLAGTVRILCPDGFGGFLLAPSLGLLTDTHPELQVELLTVSPVVTSVLSEFDIGVVQQDVSSPRVKCRHLTDYVVRLYATPEYLASRPPLREPVDLRQHVTIWYLESILAFPQLGAVLDALPQPVRIRSTNLISHWQAAAAGVGVAPIPHFIAARDPRLVRVLPQVEFVSSYWIAAPAGHTRLARVQALERHLLQTAARHQSELLGRNAAAGRDSAT